MFTLSNHANKQHAQDRRLDWGGITSTFQHPDQIVPDPNVPHIHIRQKVFQRNGIPYMIRLVVAVDVNPPNIITAYLLNCFFAHSGFCIEDRELENSIFLIHTHQ